MGSDLMRLGTSIHTTGSNLIRIAYLILWSSCSVIGREMALYLNQLVTPKLDIALMGPDAYTHLDAATQDGVPGFLV